MSESHLALYGGVNMVRAVNEVPTDGTEHATYERNPRRRRK